MKHRGETTVVTISGASGAIAPHVAAELVRSGLGTDSRLEIRLLVKPDRLNMARALSADLEDMAADRLASVCAHDDPIDAFSGCDVAILAASAKRTEGATRADLGAANARVTVDHAALARRLGSEAVRIAVVANPVNALVTAIVESSDVEPERVSGVVRIDLARAIRSIAAAWGVAPSCVRDVAIWGNHSTRLAVDLWTASVDGRSVSGWHRPGIVEAVRSRGDEVIALSGRTAAVSVAAAVQAHLEEWLTGRISAGLSAAAVISDGSHGLPEGIALTVPVVSYDRRWTLARVPQTAEIVDVVEAAAAEIRTETNAMRAWLKEGATT